MDQKELLLEIKDLQTSFRISDEYGFLKLTYLLINIYVNFGNVSNKKGG